MEELGWRPLPSGVDVDVVFPSGDEVSFDEFFRSLLINEPPAYSRHSTAVHRAFRFFRKFCIELSEGKIGRPSSYLLISSAADCWSLWIPI